MNREEYIGILETDNAELKKENQQLREKIKTYEDPEDLTLMFMYCDEKAKDKIKELQEQNKKYKEVIDKAIKELNDYLNINTVIRDELLDILKEVE